MCNDYSGKKHTIRNPHRNEDHHTGADPGILKGGGIFFKKGGGGGSNHLLGSNLYCK